MRVPSLKALVLTSLGTSSTYASPEPFPLEWSRAESALLCPTESEVREDVENRLGIAGPRGPYRARVIADISRADGVFRAEIRLVDLDGRELGRRSVESGADDCTSLSRAAALAIVLLVESEPASFTTPPTVPPPISPPSGCEVATPPSPLEEKRDGLEAGVAVSMIGAVGVLPEPTLGVGIGGDLRWTESLHLHLRGLFLPERTVERAEARVGFGLTAASLGLCHRASLTTSLGIGVCASFLGGAHHVVVFAPESVAPGDRPWFAGGAGATADLKAGEFEGALGIETLFPFPLRDFRVETPADRSSESIHRMSSVGVMATLSVGWGSR